MQDFPAFVREHVKNTGTKPVQADLTGGEFWRRYEKKNPRSAATEAGIKSFTKACSFQTPSYAKALGKAIGDDASHFWLESAT